MTPREAKTIAQVYDLPRDNVDTDAHWILTDGITITLRAQRNGEPSTESITLPRATFEAFIDWYNTGKFKRPQKKARRKP